MLAYGAGIPSVDHGVGEARAPELMLGTAAPGEA